MAPNHPFQYSHINVVSIGQEHQIIKRRDGVKVAAALAAPELLCYFNLLNTDTQLLFDIFMLMSH
jgi:hypothetical protein